MDKTNQMKEKLNSLILLSLQIRYSKQHPIRVINACKSLIGIDPENPPYVMLKWLESFIINYEPDFEAPKITKMDKMPEVITFNQLNKLIDSNNLDEAYIYLEYLLQSAAPLSISEYLLELSINKSYSNFLYCWSAYRIIQSLGEKKGYPILFHSVSSLIENKVYIKEIKINEYEIFCHQFHIYRTEMVRKNKIFVKFEELLKTLSTSSIKTVHNELPAILINMVNDRGIKGIRKYICSLEVEQISIELIFKLAALRSLIYFSDISLNNIITGDFIKE